MKKILTLLLVTLFGALPKAEAATVDLGEIELDKVYELTGNFSDYIATFTAPKDGTLTTVWSSSAVRLYPFYDATYQEEVPNTWAFLGDGTGMYEIAVTTGTTYYFQKTFLMENGWFKFSMEEKPAVELVELDPAEGSLYSTGGIGMIYAYFSRPLKCSNVVAVIDGTAHDLPFNVSGTGVAVSAKETMKELFEQGTIQAHQHFTVEFRGICATSDENIIYGTDGVLSVDYEMADPPVQIVSTVGLEDGTFYSYWPEGDPSAIFSITFDGELLNDESRRSEQICALGFGNPEGEVGEYYYETLTYDVVNGNTVQCDFSGKLRRPQDMVDSGTNYGSMLVKFLNVKGADGTYAYVDGEGSQGSYSYYVDYEVMSTNILSEYTPLSGSSLDGFTQVEIWLTDYDKITHDGFDWTYQEGTETVVLHTAEFTKEDDADFAGATILTVPVPAALVGKRIDDVTLTFSALATCDGEEHEDVLVAHYSFGSTDGIRGVSADGATAKKVYGVDGRRLRPEVKVTGVRIVDGKKQVVK